eukprot:UN04910
MCMFINYILSPLLYVLSYNELLSSLIVFIYNKLLPLRCLHIIDSGHCCTY